ncbi:MAG: hypothetical protein HZA31_07760 [Opitutae bacterium]|nr:hypothetical protein [Opitutae bacterium]
MSRDSIDWDVAVSQTQPLLSPTQHALFRAIAARVKATRQINQLVQSATK